MDTRDILKKEFSSQVFADGQAYSELLERYKEITRNYARMENAIAVLSDLHTNDSHIYYGGFSKMLGTGRYGQEVKVSSIWEEEIFRLIHPDDLTDKHLQELSFFHFVRSLPPRTRPDYYLASVLRMKNVTDGSYIPVLHRIFYISVPGNGSFRMALCLYGPLVFDMPSKCLIINSANGQTMELEKQDNTRILSDREKQVLNLIDKGLTSKSIAGMLCISINTVSRHRQSILEKLQVKNSIEACRIAKELKLL